MEYPLITYSESGVVYEIRSDQTEWMVELLAGLYRLNGGDNGTDSDGGDADRDGAGHVVAGADPG